MNQSLAYHLLTSRYLDHTGDTRKRQPCRSSPTHELSRTRTSFANVSNADCDLRSTLSEITSRPRTCNSRMSTDLAAELINVARYPLRLTVPESLWPELPLRRSSRP